MLGHQSVTMTIRYLGLRDENSKAAGDVLAARYPSLRAEGDASWKSVPESVPTTTEEGANGMIDSTREVERFSGCNSMVECQPSNPIEYPSDECWE